MGASAIWDTTSGGGVSALRIDATASPAELRAEADRREQRKAEDARRERARRRRLRLLKGATIEKVEHHDSYRSKSWSGDALTVYLADGRRLIAVACCHLEEVDVVGPDE